MKHLDPKAVWLFFFSNITVAIFAAFFLAMFIGVFLVPNINTSEPNLKLLAAILGGSFAVFLILSYLLAKLTYKNYKYELTHLSFKKEGGIIYKSYVSIPYERIQNVDIYRGLLQRILGLSDLHIQTAGYSGGMVKSEARLLGLSKETAQELQEELIKRCK